MNRVLLIMVFVCCGLVSKSQNATFIILDNTKNLYKVTIGASGCTSTFLSFCTNFTGTPLSIALDGNILYVADNKGFLYKNTLGINGTLGNCTKLGSFPITAGIYGLTVGNGGIVYAATGSSIETYNPATNAFATLGTMPSQWTIGGDLIFYKSKLYEAVKVGASGTNALIEIDLTNVANSSLYMNFNAGTSVFGFASVTVPCQNNQAYALSSNGNTTDIFAVDMTNKTQASNIFCTLNYNVYDAASIAETQSATPPVTVPLSYSSCTQVTYLGNVYTTSTNVKDTVKSVQGCDSIYHDVTITIGSNIATTQTLNLSGCNNVVYKGNTYTTNTTLKDTVKSLMGCGDSIYNVINISLITPKNDTINLFDCKAVLYKGNTYTYPTIIRDTLKAIGGCDSIYNVANISIGKRTEYAYITNYGDSSIQVINIKTNQIVAIIKVGDRPDGICISPDGKRAYVSNWSSSTVSVINTQKNIVITNIPVGYQPIGICVSIDGTKVYVANQFSNTVSVISTLTNQLINNINVGNQPIGVCASPDGTKLYVSNWSDNNISIINTSNNTVVGTIQVGNGPFGINVSPNGAKIYVTNNSDNSLSIINAFNNMVIATIPLGIKPRWIATNQNTNSVYVSNDTNYISVIDFSTNNVIATIKVGNNPCGISTNFNGSKVYVLNYNDYTLSIIDAASNVVLSTSLVGNWPMSLGNFIANVPDTTTTNLQNFSDCKFITYGGNTYIASTVLRDTVKSYQGCDSVYNVVNIIVNSSITNTKTITSCKAIVYNGSTYNTSTILRDTVKSFQGCDSIYNVVNININPIIATTNTKTFTSCKAIVYNGSTYSTSTILKDTVKSFQGCDSIYNIINININPVITKTYNTSLSGCNIVNYLGHIYTSSTIVSDTVKSFYGCDSIYNNTAINVTHINPVIIADTISGCDTTFYNGIIYTSSAILQSTVKSYQGCDSVYSIHNINVYPSPKVVGSNNVNILPNASVVLHPIVSNASLFNWTPAIYLNNPTIQNPTCTPQKDTTYKIVVSNKNGCKDSSYIKVTVIKQLNIPNVFSPNNDGINDTWVIDGLQTYKQSTVQVFNRWGQKVFNSFFGSYKPWDGMYKGNLLPLGVYYYIIKLSPDAPVISGVITILK